MKKVIFPGSCAVALCLLLSSFISSGGDNINVKTAYTVSSVNMFQDTVPQRASGMKKGAKGNMPKKGGGTWDQGKQGSDTRGEGINKGKRGMKQKAVDSTNHGAMNTIDTTKA